jgi:hypothetical protein
VDAIEARQSGEEHLLNHIVDIGVISAQHASGHPCHVAGMALEKRIEIRRGTGQGLGGAGYEL